MITIQRIGPSHRQDIWLPNEPFVLFGRLIPRYVDRRWDYTIERWETVAPMCFPDERYDYDAMADASVFLGAYDQAKCIGLAVVQQAAFQYMYLYDLKVCRAYRRRGVAGQLLRAAKDAALAGGYRGIYTVAQDNNLGACLFYLRSGFRIGGLDTLVYQGTPQAGKADVFFYLDC